MSGLSKIFNFLKRRVISLEKVEKWSLNEAKENFFCYIYNQRLDDMDVVLKKYPDAVNWSYQPESYYHPMPALGYARYNNKFKAFQHLLDRGADPDTKFWYSRTNTVEYVINFAISEMQVKFVRALALANADLVTKRHCPDLVMSNNAGDSYTISVGDHTPAEYARWYARRSPWCGKYAEMAAELDRFSKLCTTWENKNAAKQNRKPK